MNNNKLIIAAAGAGKTTYIIKEALRKKKRILILTYTISNKGVIERNIINENTCIPSNITIQTWFSFLLQHGVRPYQGCLNENLFDREIKGLILVNEASASKHTNRLGHKIYWSEETDFMKHYFNKDLKIYSDKIAKFVYKCNKISENAIITRLASIYDLIYIDEVQDLAGYDLELIKLLFQSSIEILLVGDPRQVTYLTHHEKKHGKYKYGGIERFIEDKLGKRCKCEIDKVTLNLSHRCSHAICQFATMLYPRLPITEPCKCCNNYKVQHRGIFIIEQDNLEKYVKNYSVMQLRWDKRRETIPNIPVMNFGESKGETFDRVLIYPTGDMLKWLKDNNTKLSNEVRAKYYVALTRAKYSVGIVVDDVTKYPGYILWRGEE